MRCCQRQLISVGEIEVVDAEDKRGETLSLLQGLGQRAHEGSLPYALQPVQTDDEGPRGSVAGSAPVLLPVRLELGEDEWDAYGGFIVDHPGLEGGIWSAGHPFFKLLLFLGGFSLHLFVLACSSARCGRLELTGCSGEAGVGQLCLES